SPKKSAKATLSCYNYLVVLDTTIIVIFFFNHFHKFQQLIICRYSTIVLVFSGIRPLELDLVSFNHGYWYPHCRENLHPSFYFLNLISSMRISMFLSYPTNINM
ncbi:hypothetical protein TorRG33x02_210420, partial [Trema orientale]